MGRRENAMPHQFMAPFRRISRCGLPRRMTGAAAVRAGAMLLALILYLPFGAAQAASFDCATATSAAEKAICDNRALNDQDVKMATLYEVLSHLVAMGQRGELQDAQRAWLKGRAQCKGNVACLRTAYESRIHTLQQALQDIYQNGPY